MSDVTTAFIRLLEEDRRYTAEAYQFIREALSFGQEVPDFGREPSEVDECSAPNVEVAAEEQEQHLTGQQLCEAARLYALDQYGYLAKTVLGSWGVRSTGDFGEIVYSLIRIGSMRKSDSDDRQDFDDVYDFDLALREQYRFNAPDST